jgi:uncharacterized membrane-anchored protein
MKKYKWAIILLNLVVLLVYFNTSIAKKERILTNGKLILLELQPAKSRSLMQGDYMALKYLIAEKPDVNMGKRGCCVVMVDSNNVGQLVRFQPGKFRLDNSETLIEYTYQDKALKVGAESFFFQEGQAKKYDSAMYGGLKVDERGNSVLVGLYDRHFRKL